MCCRAAQRTETISTTPGALAYGITHPTLNLNLFIYIEIFSSIYLINQVILLYVYKILDSSSGQLQQNEYPAFLQLTSYLAVANLRNLILSLYH